MKTTFAPCLIKYTGNNIYDAQKHYEKFSEIIDFIVDCVNEPEIDYFHSTEFNNVFYALPRYSKSTSLNNKIRTDILPKIQKHLSTLISTNANENDYGLVFDNYLSYLINNNINTIIFVGEQNKHLEGQGYPDEMANTKNCTVVFNPYMCDYNLIENIIKNDLTENVALCKEICKHTNKYFDPYRKLRDDERNKYDFEFGKRVAIRNKYVYNHRLSHINTMHNSGRRRDVYIKYEGARKKPKYYISVDTENGAIELFKHKKSGNPEHLGEFNFSCDSTQDADSNTHILYLQ